MREASDGHPKGPSMIQESSLPDEASYPGTPGVTDIEAQADVRDLPQLEDTDLQAAESAPASSLYAHTVRHVFAGCAQRAFAT
jgi:hypothetical protein